MIRKIKSLFRNKEKETKRCIRNNIGYILDNAEK